MQAELEPVQFKVQKTRISFYKKQLFGCGSFLRVKKKKDLPEHSLALTFGDRKRNLRTQKAEPPPGMEAPLSYFKKEETGDAYPAA